MCTLNSLISIVTIDYNIFILVKNFNYAYGVSRSLAKETFTYEIIQKFSYLLLKVTNERINRLYEPPIAIYNISAVIFYVESRKRIVIYLI